jgi:transcriptional regulator GlxA family with amidase domain
MKHLTIIVPDGQSTISGASCILGAYDIFTKANQYWKQYCGKELFKIQLAGVSKKVEFNDGLLTLKPDANISTITKTNLIVIPAMLNEKAIKRNKVLAEWIAEQYKNGAEISSMCTGAFMLASAGLLDGKNCSTHWSAVDSFRTMFPKVNLQIEKLITDENGIYTNGGGYSFLNLIIYLVEKYYDRQTAIYCSKIFQVELDRQSQSPFTIFTGQKSHQDDIVRKAQAYIETRLNEKISIRHLSTAFAVGRRSFDRRFIKATGNTPAEYWQRVKIEAAKKAFETSGKTINEVMYEVGYSDVKKFRELFKKITGMLPLEYKSRYNKERVISNGVC